MGARSIKLLLLGILILLFDIVLFFTSSGISAFILLVAGVGLLVGIAGMFVSDR